MYQKIASLSVDDFADVNVIISGLRRLLFWNFDKSFQNATTTLIYVFSDASHFTKNDLGKALIIVGIRKL